MHAWATVAKAASCHSISAKPFCIDIWIPRAHTSHSNRGYSSNVRQPHRLFYLPSAFVVVQLLGGSLEIWFYDRFKSKSCSNYTYWMDVHVCMSVCTPVWIFNANAKKEKPSPIKEERKTWSASLKPNSFHWERKSLSHANSVFSLHLFPKTYILNKI